MLGSLISAGANLISGMLGRNAQEEANEKNAAIQKEFAQNSIQWKVADAQKAGVSPIYALGAPSYSASPSFIGDSPMGSAMAAIGQDVSRAVDAGATGQDKYDATVRALTVKRMGLENDLLASQIANVRQAGSPPAFPGSPLVLDGQGDVPLIEAKPPQTTTYLRDPRGVMKTQPLSDASTYEDRYGDLVQEAYGIRNWIWDHFPETMRSLSDPWDNR